MSNQSTGMKPTVVGSGLVALDVVVSEEDKVEYFGGGTCGNVLTILSYLGWKSKPVARLKDDVSAEMLTNDLAKWGVDTAHMTRTGDGSTPVIVQRNKKNPNGIPTHSFSLRCPCCSAYLPGYKPILGSAAKELTACLPQHQVFFFDRVSRGTLNLAQHSADCGAVVVFEPSGVGDPRLFREAWGIAHVVKYSNDRLRDIADLDLKSERNTPLLEVETLGDAGLRYRSRLPNASTKSWKKLKAIPVSTLRDAAGSGDWCTAGLVHRLLRGGSRGFRRVEDERLIKALRYGQALASWNCSYVGARGGMYQVSKDQFDRQIRRLLAGKIVRPTVDDTSTVSEDLSKLCPTCESGGTNSRKTSA